MGMFYGWIVDTPREAVIKDHSVRQISFDLKNCISGFVLLRLCKMETQNLKWKSDCSVGASRFGFLQDSASEISEGN